MSYLLDWRAEKKRDETEAMIPSLSRNRPILTRATAPGKKNLGIPGFGQDRGTCVLK